MPETIPQKSVRMPRTSPSVPEAFAYCEKITRRHYENFPVASLFLPREKRPYICAVYAFARTADDYADEGTRTHAERLYLLDEWEKKLDAAYEGRPDGPVFVAIAETAARTGIPKNALADLLEAFRMDVTNNSFNTFDDLLRYCRHSANPVGRLVLHIFDAVSDRAIEQSDALCTGLQLANFWQDVSNDLARGRLYIPLEDIARYGYTESELRRGIADERFRTLMAFEVQRTKDFFEKGRPLLTETIPALRTELRLTWRGGMTILRKIEQARYDVLDRRPAISLRDKLVIMAHAIFRSSP